MYPTLNKDSILQTIAAHKKQLVSYGVIKIGMFGSFVRNQTTNDSDIDFLVDIIKEKKTFRNFMNLNYYLEDLFGRKVDLVTTQSLSPYIGPHILKSVEYVSLTD